MSHLNADEWQAVQGIWDTINSAQPDIAALQRRLTGVEPPKVEARKVATPLRHAERRLLSADLRSASVD